MHEKHIAEDPNYFWALRDINLEVRQGEVVGIIGRNGAGKSTLLKILSRITPPTTGKITYNGRIASLLEVGTGFHRELTGRENIFLNGSILGMKRAEIAKKFDEIVAFAEVEKFIDTPVKFYSSGMYVRLAFAVAAHLEPEILVVDEVLAVGDAQFQKKCLGKMGDVAKQGRTILFVSHNMAAVARLCKTAVWIHCGAIVVRANSDVVLNQYLNSAKSKGGEYRALSLETAPGNERLRLMRVTVKNSNGEPADSLEIEQPFHVEIEYEVLQSIPSVRVGFCLLSNDGTIVFTSGDTDPEGLGTARTVGRHVSTCTIPGSLLNVGRYFLSVSSDIPMQEILFTVENVVGFDIAMTGGVGGSIPDNRQGIVRLLLAWKTGVA